MSTPALQAAPTVANIDQNYLLTVNWTPFDVNGNYSIYSGWNLFVATPPGNTPVTYFTTGTAFGGTVSSPSFDQQLTSEDYTLDMQGLSSDLGQFLNSPHFNNPHEFPHALTSTLVSFDNTTLSLGQTLTITLSGSYDGSIASGWQVLYQDGTTSGPLPLTSRTTTKIFTAPGQQNIVVQVFANFTNAAPAVKLTRSFSFSVFVINQQFTTAPQTSITGTLGVAGEQGFEIVNNTTSSVQAAPYEVIVRNLVRDTITNELKLLVATSRFSNASSLLGTMALDVFPVMGRPQATEPLTPLGIVPGSSSSASPTSITTTSMPSNSFIGIPQEYFQFMTAGPASNGPFSWFATGLPPGLRMSIDGTISGTPTQLGTFTVNISVMDSSTPTPFIAQQTFSYTVLTNLAITSTSLPGATVLTPYTTTVKNSGGLLPFTWSIQSGTLPIGLVLNPSTGVISGIPCSYNTTDYVNPFSVTIQVQDAVGALASATFQFTLSRAALQLGFLVQPTIFAGQDFRLEVPVLGGTPPYTLFIFTDDGTYALNPNGDNYNQLDNGKFELQIAVPSGHEGTHSFTITVNDIAAGLITQTFYYNVNKEISNILVTHAAFDHIWGSGDGTSSSFSITGPLGGFLINQNNLLVQSDFSRSNGLVVTVDPSGPKVTVVGPPSAPYNNIEARVHIPLTNGTATVATIVQEFSLITHSGTSDIGTVSTYTGPYIVGNFIGLDPRRPYFNSPQVFNSPYTVRVQSGSSLPSGLSLDQISGLVYGNLTATFGTLSGGNTSVFEYIDAYNVVHGTVTVFWDTVSNAVPLQGTFASVPINRSFAVTISSQATNLASASVYRGHLPAGTILSATGSTVTWSGAPTEAGYFDVWIAVTTTTGATGYIYQRLAVTYSTPALILTASLPNIIVNQAYSTTLQGYGGVPAYTWTSDMATSFPALVAYITLNPSTGVLSGTVPPAAGLEGQSATITFTLTDSVGSVTRRQIVVHVFSTLLVATISIPPITINVPYSFQMTATGGLAPYAWTNVSASLPTGITIDSSGLISGTTAQAGYGTQSVNFIVTDSLLNTANKSLAVTVGIVAGMTISTAGVGDLLRGVPYLGTLSVSDPSTPGPSNLVSWSVILGSLPSGLSLTASVSDYGTTAKITGVFAGAAGAQPSFTVQTIDQAGHLATAIVTITATTNLAINPPPFPGYFGLPTATVGVAITPIQLTATGGGDPSGGTPVYTWSIPSPPPGFPFSLSSGGLLQGTGGVATTWNFTVQVVDAMSPADTASHLFTMQVTSSTLIIFTTTLGSGEAGVAYSKTLQASGGVPPYTWSLVAGTLPTGITVSTGGILGGTTNQTGNFSFTVQVQDSIGSKATQAFNGPSPAILTINTGLTLSTGIDYVNSLNLGILGYVGNGDVTTIGSSWNRSFIIVASHLLANDPSQMSVTVPAGFSVSFPFVFTRVTGGGASLGYTAFIVLSGPFANGTLGSNNFPVTVTDVGGIVGFATFTWVVYSNGALSLGPTVGTVPAYGVPLLEGTAGSLPIYNAPGAFNFQTYNGAAVDKAQAAHIDGTGDFSLSADNSASSGIVSFSYANPNFQYAYAGGALPSGVALTDLTLTDFDIAWFDLSYPSTGTEAFDLFGFGSGKGGQQLVTPFLYMVMPTVSVSGTSIGISNNTFIHTVGPSTPQTEADVQVTSGSVGWVSFGNLKNGGSDTITLYGSDNSNAHISHTLNMTNMGFSIPANATITNATVSLVVSQSAGSSETFQNGVTLIGTAHPPSAQSGVQVGSGRFDFVLSGVTPNEANSSAFGFTFYLQCTQQPGTGAVLQVSSAKLSLTYTVPSTSSVAIVFYKPLSPQQQGTASSTGNTVNVFASINNGASIVSITPTYGSGALAGWLTGYTAVVQFPPAGSGTYLFALSLSLSGHLTYLSGTTITSGTITYVNGQIATITVVRS